MELTQTHFERIAHLFPKQRGNVSLSHLAVLKPSCTWPSRMQVAWIRRPSGTGTPSTHG